MTNRIKRLSTAALCAIAFLGQVAQAQSPDLSLPNTTHSSGNAAYQATNSITAASGFTVNGSASVTFTAGQVIQLKPGFQATAGSAAVTFRANIGTVAMTETISTPAPPSGPANGGVGASLTYTASGAASNLGHPVQYRFDWGDGSTSGWLPSGTVSASHAWTSPGAFQVTVQARCANEIGVVSAASSLSVTVAPPDFTLSLSAASSTIVAGTSASFTVTVSSLAGFNGLINLETAGVPGGATVTFTDPATGLSAPTLTGFGVRTMTITTRLSDMGGAVGNFAFILTGRSGSLAHSATLALTVQDFSVTFSKSLIDVTCSGGDVSFEAKAAGNNGWALPGQFSFEGFWSAPNSLISTQWPGAFTVQIVPVDNQTATFHLHLNPWAPWAGCMQRAFWMKIKGVSSAGTSHVGWSALATNSAGGPSDYRITLPSPSQNVSGPGLAQYPVWVESMGAYIGPVSLEVIGLPAGVSVNYLSPNPVNLAANTGIAALVLNVGSGVPPGTYSFTVRSPGGAGTHSATGSLTVGQGGPRQYTVSTAPAGLQFSVNGQAYSTPQAFTWEDGTYHTLWAPPSQTVGGSEYDFVGWSSDGGDALHGVTAGVAPAALTANFIFRAPGYELGTPSPTSITVGAGGQPATITQGIRALSNWRGTLNLWADLPEGVLMNVRDFQGQTQTNVTVGSPYRVDLTQGSGWTGALTFVAAAGAPIGQHQIRVRLGDGVGSGHIRNLPTTITQCNNLPCGCVRQSFTLQSVANGDSYGVFSSWSDGASPSVAPYLSVQTDRARLIAPSGQEYGPSQPGNIVTGTAQSIVRLPGATTTFKLAEKGFGTYTASFVTHAFSAPPAAQTCPAADYNYSYSAMIGPPVITQLSQNRAQPGETLNGVVVQGSWLSFPGGGTTVTGARLMAASGTETVPGTTVTFTGMSGPSAMVNIVIGNDTPPGVHRLALTALGAEVTMPFTVDPYPEVTISGKVTRSGSSGNEEPMSGVRITLEGNGTLAFQDTGSDGRYSFSVSADGTTYTVKPSLLGYYFAPVEVLHNNIREDRTTDFLATPQVTVYLIHGINQAHSAMLPLYNKLTSLSNGVDLSRARFDAGFEFGDCATVSNCSANCSVGYGGARLAQHIRDTQPPGDVILVGYSMGGLIARDVIANHSQNLGGRKVLKLITLGTPHLGYPYASADGDVLCRQLVEDMAGSWYPNHNPPAAASSVYLNGLTQQWASSSFTGDWFAAAGTSCGNSVRTFGSLDPRGCLPTSPRSDGIVCRDSAVYSGALSSGRSPTATWEDPQQRYVHTITSPGFATGLVLCSNSGDALVTPPLYDPPTNDTLFVQIRTLINGY